MIQGLIVFSDNTGQWWLKFLKPGFRHCFLILRTERGGIWLDPISNGISLYPLEDFEVSKLAKWYRLNGMRVLTFKTRPSSHKPFFWAPLTCVEVIKRVLGVRDWRIFTPWQLYQHLKENK